jgi:hypothetical protein
MTEAASLLGLEPEAAIVLTATGHDPSRSARTLTPDTAGK